MPIFCLLGAGLSIWRRHERKQLINQVAQSDVVDALNGMSWQQFELLVGEGFRLRGYRVVETGGGGADGGVDLVLHKDREKYLVQCKQWRAYRIGVKVVRELYGLMAAQGAAGGFVVTSGHFTDEANKFAQNRNLHLINGVQFYELIKQAQARQAQQVMQQESKKTIATTSFDAPLCPLCSKTMVRRMKRKGANAGREFWGCSDFPVCRKTRAID